MKLIHWYKRTKSLKKIGYAFTDVVVGKPVYYYMDHNGDTWMKTSKWALFEVKRK